MKKKVCTGCKKRKLLEMYSPDKRASDGRVSRCKECMMKRSREYRLSTPRKIETFIF